jgi:uncharacterized membrane protein YphA (DoxX/SURF4 family)
MQILTTEHWSLLSSRSLAWNEAFARVGMYLTALTGAMVALGLVAGLNAVVLGLITRSQVSPVSTIPQ